MQNIAHLISEIVEFSQNNYSKNELDFVKFEHFLRKFYCENVDRDLMQYSVEELSDCALSSFRLFEFRKNDEIKIQILNPNQSHKNPDDIYTLVNIINEDKPFLVDSVASHLDKIGVKIRNIMHPVYSVLRDDLGKLDKISIEKFTNSTQESVIQLHIDRITSDSEIKIVEEKIVKILRNLGLMVADWQKMIELTNKASEQIDNAKKISEEVSEIKEFISWIANGNFIFLGAKEFDIKEIEQGRYELEEVPNSSLGIFRSPDEDFRPEVMNSSFAEVCDSVANPYVIEILKSRYRSRIHRVANAERIRVQKISSEGKVIGEFRFIGLFTSAAYHESISSIPLIRGKVAKIIQDSGYVKGSHNYKDLISVLQSYPRDELFQISSVDLLKNATGIVAICGRSQVRFFAREDKFKRFVSCLIFTPRERSNSDLREKIKEYLADLYNGEIADSFVQITDSNLIRFHLIVRTNNGIPTINEFMVEQEITKMTRIWSDDLSESIKSTFGDEKRISLLGKYKNAFSISYINRFDAKSAASDIKWIEECLESKAALFNLNKDSENLPEDVVELKIYSAEKEIILSEIMPILESFGFNVIQEHTYTVTAEEDAKNRSKQKAWIHYFHLNLSKHGHKFSQKTKENFEETISLIWQQFTQVGFLNRLVVTADLNWKQIYMLRGYMKYLYQTGFKYGQSYVADVLVKHREITKMLVEFFETKFDPSLKVQISERKIQIEKISNAIKDSLNQVKEVTDDAVIRRFLGAIDATLRTNYYQVSDQGSFKGYVSFKFDSKKVPELPLPLPYAEIFVYSPRVEAIHLRGGKVARGGLRWSDRQEDFRTEVLGLVKAQTTKNAVIVPVGSKGGFVLKSDTSSMNRDELQKEGIECYKTFLRGLLDITDNVVNGQVEHPKDVVLHDAADPYLVVAADKGTATFSDIANGISADYNFWLGDAFASGGSVGYDHKKMGITAKGGWVSVMRHFREMGRDSQKQDFTCVGIGDLAGDVFGNGMLLSKHIRLVAAFNHMHIFLDPNPDSATSFIERERMFNLPRSSWMDYDKSKISQGGGVFERSAKSIKLSAEVKQSLDIEEDELTPTELIRAILKAPVDLLWNGGIGTYVKASDEANQEVGDRANDSLRINGNELRCKIVGEGGNLGFTQKGRIEYALNGGSVNTDAMDNSAGVDCSDHEVNIKIALISAMRSKKITLEERNKILESMTDEVSDLVLSDNRLQTQAISVAQFQGYGALGDQSQFLDRLEKIGLLNRKIEFLPSKKEIDKRQIDKVGLTRPELCVMLAYSKMDIYNQLLISDLLEDKYFESELFSYFPKLMQDKFAQEVANHQLRREIIATQITNFVVNRVGITFINQIAQDSGFSIVEVVKNFIIAADSFRLREVWSEIENLDGKIATQVQMQMFLSTNKLLERSIMWLLRNQPRGDLLVLVNRFRKIADELSAVFPQVLAKASRDSFERKVERYCLSEVERNLAAKIAAMDPVASAFDIAEISAASKVELRKIATIYFAVGTRFSLKWLRSRVNKLSLDSYWQRLSSKTILEDLYSYQLKIAKSVVENCNDEKDLCEVGSIDKWIKSVEFLVERLDNFVDELKMQPNPDLSVFIVALNRLKPLVK